MNTEEWITKAKEIGFSEAGALDTSTLTVREDVRAMCAEDRCHAYGHNWTCPPTCGTLEECQAKMRSYQHGIIVQTVGHMSKDIDAKCYRETEKKHMDSLRRFAELMKAEYPDSLCLGAGGCRICKKCNYPEPCRFPDKAYSSMEGYGLFVTQVCRENGLEYYYGPRTITYTGCVLY
jgi:predicted metal-binding protein